MAFNWKQFAAGFMEKAVSDFETEKAERKELFKADYVDKLEQARSEREKRRQEKKALRDAGRRLMGIDGMTESAASAVLLNEGAEGAEDIYKLVRAQEIAGADVNIDEFVGSTYDSNLTINDAVNQVMGELVPVAPGAKPPAMGEQSFFGKLFNMDKVDERTVDQFQKAFGEDYQQIASEARAEYDYEVGPSGTVQIDYSALKESDPMEDLKRRALEIEVELAEKKLAEGDSGIEPMSASDSRAARKDILAELSTEMQIDLQYDPQSGLITSAKGTADQLALATRLASTGMELIQAYGGGKEGGYPAAYNKTIRTLLGRAAVTDAKDPNAIVEDETVEVPSPEDQEETGLPTYSPSQDPTTYVTSVAQELNIASMGRRDKATEKKRIVTALTAGGTMNAVEAQKIVNSVIK